MMGIADLYGEDIGYLECHGAEGLYPVLLANGGPDDEGRQALIMKDGNNIMLDVVDLGVLFRIWDGVPTEEERMETEWLIQ